MFFTTFTVDKILESVKNSISNYYDSKEEARLEKEREFARNLHMPQRSSTLRRTGYAFAQEDHAAPLIIDNLSKGVKKIFDE